MTTSRSELVAAKVQLQTMINALHTELRGTDDPIGYSELLNMLERALIVIEDILTK